MAQLGYTVSFTLDHAGKIKDRRQIKNRHTAKTKHNPEKANNAKHSRTKLASYDTSARKQGGLILQS